MKRIGTLLWALGLAGLTSIPSQAATVETKGFLKYECWFPPLRDALLTGTTVDVLDSDPNYVSNTPDLLSYTAGFTSRPVFPEDTHNEYGARISGWITPIVTGDYNFFLASDDSSELWISTDATEANLQQVAVELECCKGFLEVGNSQTTTTPLSLVAGQKYAIRILLKEGGGGDYVQVAMQVANGTIPAPSLTPLVSTMLSSMADPAGASLTITQHPVATSTPENQSATFTIAATAVTPYGQYTGGGTPVEGSTPPLGTKTPVATFYQWFTNGVEVVGANGTNYTIAWPKKAQNGLKVKCYVAVPGIPLFSSEVALTVTADTTPPTVLKASSDINFDNVVVQFSEPMNDTALASSHYVIDQGVTVSSVSRVDLQTVKLATSKLAENKIFKLTINGVQDTATPGNLIAANTQVQFRSFVFVSGNVLHQKYTGVSDNTGGNVDNLFADPRFSVAPDRRDLEVMWEYPANGVGRDQTTEPDGAAHRNYFDSIEGFFIPPTSGNYVFFTCGADRWWLYLSTDENPANKHMIAAEPGGWTDPRMWNTGHDTDMQRSRSDTSTFNTWEGGSTITLEAGKRYYLMSVHHDPSWCGADDFAATYKLESEPDPVDKDAPRLTGNVVGYYFDPNGASVTFTTQPQDATVVQGSSATFTAAATGISAYGSNVLFQWESAPKVSTTWTAIAGATAAVYKTPLLTASDNGRQYRLVASVPPISETSSVATLTVTSDTTPPVVTVGAMLSSTGGTVDVGVGFDETVDEASGKLLSNYSISSGTITSLTWYTNRFTANSQNPLAKFVKQTACLKVTGLSGSAMLTVKNIVDKFGNKINSVTLPFTVDTKMKWDVVGANEAGGWNTVVPVAANGWDVYSDSVGAWAGYDEATFVYEQITGDFDKKVRVEYQDGSSQWARAGLIVRDVPNFGMDRTTQAGSGATAAPYDGLAGRYQKVLVSPVGATLTGPGTAGAQDWELNRRLDTGGQTSGAPFTGANSIPQYPNAWCRLQRVGQKFTTFRSDDGVNWVALGSTTWGVDDEAKAPMPATLYVGPDYAPEIGNLAVEADKGTFLAQFREYGDYVAVFNPQLTIGVDATGKMTITWTSGTLVSSPSVQGTYTPVPGASSSTPYIVTPSGAAAMFYRVKQ